LSWINNEFDFSDNLPTRAGFVCQISALLWLQKECHKDLGKTILHAHFIYRRPALQGFSGLV
jgi:hypothetical protein